MRIPRVAPALLLVFLSPALPRAHGLGLFRSFWGDAIVATDLAPEGKALTPPTPEQPVYYLGLSLGSRLGSIRGDEMPDVREMNQLVAKILAKQGYLGARPGVHDPSLYLVIQWGYLEPRSGELLWFLGYDPSQDIASPAFPGMLGPEVWRRGMRSRTTETILDSANGAIYGIIVSAFEYKTAKTDHPVIYWQTRIGLPANGKSMKEALPTMLIAAGNAIGRESKSPVLRSADDAREGSVKLDDLKFIDVLNEPVRAPDSRGKK